MRKFMRGPSSFMLTVVLIGMLTQPISIQTYRAEATTITVPDDYPTIQAAINAANPGDTIYVRAGTYYEHLVVNKSLSLIGEEGAIIDGNYSGKTVVTILADDVSVEGFIVMKSGVGLPTSGIYAYKCSNITVKNNKIIWNYVGLFLLSCNNSIVLGNDVTENGFYGVLVGYSSNNTISGNIMKKNFKGLVVSSSSNITIIENNVTENYYGGIYFKTTVGNVVRNNKLWNNKGDNFYVSGRQLTHFIHDIDRSNLVEGKPIHYLMNQENILIDPVSFPEVGYLALVNCTNIQVIDLKLPETFQVAYTKNGKITQNCLVNTEGGIVLFNSSNIVIFENNFTKNVYGIFLLNSANNYITKNNFTQNSFGIRLRYSYNNMIRGNNIIANFESGVWLEHSSNNIILENKITNGSCGLLLEYSINNKISGNNVTANKFYAIILDSSNYNHIYHNNFIKNSRQALILELYNNTWDAGYPSGGNYWSDYTGADWYSGPRQDLPGSDGIGDEPYIINKKNKDNYPLMKPYVPLRGDLNFDGKVDLGDIATAALAFGSYLGYPRWNFKADINMDGIVSIADIAIIAENFGNTN